MKLLPNTTNQVISASPLKIQESSLESLQKPEKQRNYHYWTLEDDEKLSKLAKDLNYDWRKVTLNFPNRSPAEVEQRWRQRIDPSTKKTSWSKEEDQVLQEMHKKFGGKWKLISNYLPGRLPSSIKNRFYGKIYKQPKIEKLDKGNEVASLPDDEDFAEKFLNLSDDELVGCFN